MSYACATPQSERGSARVMGVVLGGVLALLGSGVGVAAEKPLPIAKPEKFDAREGEFSVNFRIVAQDHGYFRAFCERFTFDNHFAVYHRAGGYFHASNATS